MQLSVFKRSENCFHPAIKVANGGGDMDTNLQKLSFTVKSFQLPTLLQNSKQKQQWDIEQLRRGEGEVNLNYWGILRIAPRSTGWVGGTWQALCTELANIAVCLQAWQGWHCNVYRKWSLRPRGKFHVLGTFGNCVTASLSRASLPFWINLTEI